MAGFDLSAKRDMNKGFGDALNAAVELVVTPAVMGLIGYALDGWLGIRPVLTLFLFLFTIGYVAWKHYRAYSTRMDQEQDRLLGRPADAGRSAP